MINKNIKIQSVHYGQITPEELMQTEDKLLFSFNSSTRLMNVSKLVGLKEELFVGTAFKVVFDSGLEIFCTPDQPFYTFQAKRVNITELGVGKSVRAFSMSLAKDGHYRVHGFVDHKAQHQYVAQMVYRYYFPDADLTDLIIHHKDFDKLNNHIENLELVNNSMHNAIHYPFRRDGGFHRHNHKIKYTEVGQANMPMLSLTVDKNSGIIIADPEAVSGVKSGIVIGV